MKNTTPSIKDVAKLAGTSIGTVSNVLNNRGNVSDTLSERVMQAVHELGYEVNPIARNLKSGKTKSIAILISDINCIFFPPLIKGVQNVLSKAGYTLSIFDSRREAEREREAISSMKTNWVDGMILDSFDDKEQIHKSIGTDNRKMPVISVERDLTSIGIDSVFIDNRLAAMAAVRHLIELGCRRIVHISCGESNSVLANERLCGYKDALEEAGIPFDPALVCCGDFSPISGYEVISDLLRSHIQFDAVFSANDQMAIGGLHALNNAGINIPDDVKIAGFDNTFVSSVVTPGLTTINVPSYEIGTRAANLLLNRLNGSCEPPRSVKLDYELIIRNSTITSAHSKWDMTYW